MFAVFEARSADLHSTCMWIWLRVESQTAAVAQTLFAKGFAATKTPAAFVHNVERPGAAWSHAVWAFCSQHPVRLVGVQWDGSKGHRGGLSVSKWSQSIRNSKMFSSLDRQQLWGNSLCSQYTILVFNKKGLPGQ